MFSVQSCSNLKISNLHSHWLQSSRGAIANIVSKLKHKILTKSQISTIFELDRDSQPRWIAIDRGFCFSNFLALVPRMSTFAVPRTHRKSQTEFRASRKSIDYRQIVQILLFSFSTKNAISPNFSKFTRIISAVLFQPRIRYPFHSCP